MTHPKRTKRRRSILRKIALGLGAAIIFLALLEGICRLIVLPRDAVRLQPKPDGTYRIIVLGGSTVAGEPEPALGFVAQLGAGLQSLQPGKALEVLNLGNNAMSTSSVCTRLRYALHGKPDLVITLTGHNEFLDRSDENPSLATKLRSQVDRFGLTRLIARGTRRLRVKRSRPERLTPNRVIPYDRKSDWFRQRKKAFRSNVEEMVALVQSHSVPFLICTAPCNLADWPPVHHYLSSSVPNPNYDADISRVQELLDEEKLSEAAEQTDRVLDEYGDDAMFLYLKGKIRQEQGQLDEAHELFVRAKEMDPFPWRALTEFNALIRSLSTRPGVAVVDVAAAFEASEEGRLVGLRLVADHVHPTPLGAADIACQLVREMARSGHFLDKGQSLGGPAKWLETFLEGIGDEFQQREACVSCLIASATYCMKPPFYRYRVSRWYLLRALEIDPRNERARRELEGLGGMMGRR